MQPPIIDDQPSGTNSLINEDERKRLGFQVINLGLITNIFLAAVKTTVGIIGHSPALLADGINSVSDVAYYIVVSIFMRLAGKPADEDHPYGHNQLESIAALVIGAFVITTAIMVFWESVNNVYEIWSGQIDYSGASTIALLIALLTILIKTILMLYSRKVGRQTNNPIIIALAYDHRNDIFTATAAATGIALGMIGYPWVDPLAGALVSLVILRTGIRILRESADDLMDTIPGKALKRQVTELVLGNPGVNKLEEIHAHRFGPYLVINLTIGINGKLTVQEGDRIATRTENILFDHIPNLRRVHVHYHPG
jgi:cation diffusion facilitator family transporter